MNLKQAHEHLSHDARYRRHYEKQGDAVALAMHVSAVRREAGVSQAELAKELGINTYQLSSLENLKGRVQPWVISAVVSRFQRQLRERGLQVDRWITSDRQSTEERGPGGKAPAGRRPDKMAGTARRTSQPREAMDRARGGGLLWGGRRQRSPEEKEVEP